MHTIGNKPTTISGDISVGSPSNQPGWTSPSDEAGWICPEENVVTSTTQNLSPVVTSSQKSHDIITISSSDDSEMVLAAEIAEIQDEIFSIDSSDTSICTSVQLADDNNDFKTPLKSNKGRGILTPCSSPDLYSPPLDLQLRQKNGTPGKGNGEKVYENDNVSTNDYPIKNNSDTNILETSSMYQTAEGQPDAEIGEDIDYNVTPGLQFERNMILEWTPKIRKRHHKKVEIGEQTDEECPPKKLKFDLESDEDLNEGFLNSPLHECRKMTPCKERDWHVIGSDCPDDSDDESQYEYMTLLKTQSSWERQHRYIGKTSPPESEQSTDVESDYSLETVQHWFMLKPESQRIEEENLDLDGSFEFRDYYDDGRLHHTHRSLYYRYGSNPIIPPFFPLDDESDHYRIGQYGIPMWDFPQNEPPTPRHQAYNLIRRRDNRDMFMRATKRKLNYLSHYMFDTPLDHNPFSTQIQWDCNPHMDVYNYDRIDYDPLVMAGTRLHTIPMPNSSFYIPKSPPKFTESNNWRQSGSGNNSSEDDNISLNSSVDFEDGNNEPLNFKYALNKASGGTCGFQCDNPLSEHHMVYLERVTEDEELEDIENFQPLTHSTPINSDNEEEGSDGNLSNTQSDTSSSPPPKLRKIN